MVDNKLAKDLTVWVLADSRVGNLNQAIALAEKMGLNYELKHLEYNCFGKLPNCLLALSPIHVKKGWLSSLGATGKYPDVIISSGRRTASIASYLKYKSGNKIKIIQIMHPNLLFSHFDLVILPYHDTIKKNAVNIVQVTGALNNIPDKIFASNNELHKNYPSLGRFIAVIIGGNSKHYDFSKNGAKEFAEILSNIAKNQQYTLFVSFSRRTPGGAKQMIKNNLPSSAIIYDPLEERDKPNPYLSMLATADYIIATADSISMCSEAASTGKPLYIFFPLLFKSAKHLTFVKQLVNLKIAKILDKSTTHLVPYEYTPLNEVARISNIVMNSILSG